MQPVETVSDDKILSILKAVSVPEFVAKAVKIETTDEKDKEMEEAAPEENEKKRISELYKVLPKPDAVKNFPANPCVFEKAPKPICLHRLIFRMMTPTFTWLLLLQRQISELQTTKFSQQISIRLNRLLVKSFLQ